jgi:hypothetical protein
MADMGYSYQPGGYGGQQQNGSQNGQSVSPQEALRVLSFRVPKRPQGAFTPGSLLPGAQAGGGMDASALNAIVGQLMQMMKPAGTMSQPSSPVSDGRPSGQSSVNFTPAGGAGSVVPQMPQTRGYQAPTFTPGGGDGESATDLFGNDIGRDAGGGSRQDVGAANNLSNTFSGWLDRERGQNGRGFDLSGLTRG